MLPTSCAEFEFGHPETEFRRREMVVLFLSIFYYFRVVL